MTVLQHGNIVNGPMAGRDVNYVLPQKSNLGKLFDDLQNETDGDKNLQDYIAELQIFTRSVKDEKIIGVEGKLKAADRDDDEIEMACAEKEMIFKALKENFSSSVFQRIYAQLMGRLHRNFKTYAWPAIKDGASADYVNAIVHEKVLMPVLNDVDNCGTANDITPQTLSGMIYYLTGNCHIKWRY